MRGLAIIFGLLFAAFSLFATISSAEASLFTTYYAPPYYGSSMPYGGYYPYYGYGSQYYSPYYNFYGIDRVLDSMDRNSMVGFSDRTQARTYALMGYGMNNYARYWPY